MDAYVFVIFIVIQIIFIVYIKGLSISDVRTAGKEGGWPTRSLVVWEVAWI